MFSIFFIKNNKKDKFINFNFKIHSNINCFLKFARNPRNPRENSRVSIVF